MEDWFGGVRWVAFWFWGVGGVALGVWEGSGGFRCGLNDVGVRFGVFLESRWGFGDGVGR